MTADELRRSKNAARVARYRAAHPETVRAIDQRSYDKNREKKKAYAARPDVRKKKTAHMAGYRAERPEHYQIKHRAWNYGLTEIQVMALLGEGCGVCGSKERLHIDHDHTCCPEGHSPRSCGRCVRGVLCHHCNTALGLLKEDPERITALLRYLNHPTA